MTPSFLFALLIFPLVYVVQAVLSPAISRHVLAQRPDVRAARRDCAVHDLRHRQHGLRGATVAELPGVSFHRRRVRVAFRKRRWIVYFSLYVEDVLQNVPVRLKWITEEPD